MRDGGDCGRMGEREELSRGWRGVREGGRGVGNGGE